MCGLAPAVPGQPSDAGHVSLTDPDLVLPVSGRPEDYRRVRVHDALGSTSALLEWREGLGVTYSDSQRDQVWIGPQGALARG